MTLFLSHRIERLVDLLAERLLEGETPLFSGHWILLSSQSQKQWLDETVERLKTLTDRKVILKIKGEGALNDCLIDAFAAVCYGSVADVDAVRLGVPVFAGEHSPVWPIAEHDLSRIETPSTPDRAQWLRSLAASEWSLDESNLAWERVKCLLPHTQTCKPQ